MTQGKRQNKKRETRIKAETTIRELERKLATDFPPAKRSRT